MRHGSIIKIAYNIKTKTHPRQAIAADIAKHHQAIYLHAEINAYHPLADTIIVGRFSKQLKPQLSKPCLICEIFLRSTGIKNVQHT